MTGIGEIQNLPGTAVGHEPLVAAGPGAGDLGGADAASGADQATDQVGGGGGLARIHRGTGHGDHRRAPAGWQRQRRQGVVGEIESSSVAVADQPQGLDLGRRPDLRAA